MRESERERRRRRRRRRSGELGGGGGGRGRGEMREEEEEEEEKRKTLDDNTDSHLASTFRSSTQTSAKELQRNIIISDALEHVQTRGR